MLLGHSACVVHDLTSTFLTKRGMFQRSNEPSALTLCRPQHSRSCSDTSATLPHAVGAHSRFHPEPLWLEALEECQDDLDCVETLLSEFSHHHRVANAPEESHSPNPLHLTRNSLGKVHQILKQCEKRLSKIQLNPNTAFQKGDTELLEQIKAALASRIQKYFDLMRIQYEQRISVDPSPYVAKDTFWEEHPLESKHSNAYTYEPLPDSETVTERSPHTQLFCDAPLCEESKEWLHLMKTAEEVQSIFSSLGSLVVHQGTLVNRIDYTIEQGVHHVQSGKEQLLYAERQRLKRRGSRLILFLGGFNSVLVGGVVC